MMKQLSISQRNTLLIGLSVVVLMLVAPPWRMQGKYQNGVFADRPAGYALLVSPPKGDTAVDGAQIAWGQLFVQLMIAAAVTGAVVISQNGDQSDASRLLRKYRIGCLCLAAISVSSIATAISYRGQADHFEKRAMELRAEVDSKASTIGQLQGQNYALQQKVDEARSGIADLRQEFNRLRSVYSGE